MGSNAFTKMPQPWFDEIMRSGMSRSAKLLCFWVARETLGWARTTAHISSAHLESILGMAPRQVRAARQEAKREGFIDYTKGSKWAVPQYAIVLDKNRDNQSTSTGSLRPPAAYCSLDKRGTP